MKTVSIKFLGFPHLAVYTDEEISVEAGGIARVSEEKAEALLEANPTAWEIVDRKGRPKADQKTIAALESALQEAEEAAAGYAADNEVLEGKLSEAEAAAVVAGERIAELEAEVATLKAQEIAEPDVQEG